MDFYQQIDSLVDDTQRSLGLFGPELALCGTIVLLLLLRIIVGDRLSSTLVAFTGSVMALVFAVSGWKTVAGGSEEIFTGMLVVDAFTVYFRIFLTAFAVLFVIFTWRSGIPDKEDAADFYTLALGSLLGMCLMASANHLLVVFLAIEMASVPSYVLAGILKGRKKSSEAALKFAVYGAGAAGIMLYGISLIAGIVGTVHLPSAAESLGNLLASDPSAGTLWVLGLGGLMIMVGLAFKLSAVPFHFWAPDVFEGAAAEIGGFLSVASKAAAIALLVRVAIGFGTVPENRAVAANAEIASANEAADPNEANAGDSTSDAESNDANSDNGAADDGNTGGSNTGGNDTGDGASEDGQFIFAPTAQDDQNQDDQTQDDQAQGDQDQSGDQASDPPVGQNANAQNTNEQGTDDAANAGDAAGENVDEHVTDQVAAAQTAPVIPPVDRETRIAQLAPVRKFIAYLVGFLAAITCTFGNLAAYGQTNIKRLLAYSTIAHAGYMMFAVAGVLPLIGVAGGQADYHLASVAFYVVVYLFMNFTAFAIVAFVRNRTGSEEIAHYAGLIKSSPGLVICFSLILLSLIGLPPLAGFAAKLLVFSALTKAGLWILLGVGALNTVLSLFYYLRVMKAMCMDPLPEGQQPVTFPVLKTIDGWIVFLLTLPVVFLGLFWNQLHIWAREACGQIL